VPPFEYLLLFASVILGLAVCELAIGLNRLLSAWGRIRWNTLVPLAAALTFFKLVTQWWRWHDAVGVVAGITFEVYLALLAATALLFMMAAAVFPDGRWDDQPIDLSAHYEGVRRRYWTLFSLHFVVANAITMWLTVSVAHVRVPIADPAYLALPISVSLIFIRNRFWNGLVMAGLCLVYLIQNLGSSLH
jgi:hypothetical protein